MLPNKPLTNLDLLKFRTIIPNFRGVFMRDTLPKDKPWTNECGIINLDSSKGNGTHWVAYFKKGKYNEYFDSFGDLRPPKELERYLKGIINYNHKNYQNYNQVNCGHLALQFLLNKNNL